MGLSKASQILNYNLTTKILCVIIFIEQLNKKGADMKKLVVLLGVIFLLSNIYAFDKTMIVRVYVRNYEQLQNHINFKYTNIDIAGARLNEWYELVVPQEDYPTVLRSGLNHEIVVPDLEALKEESRGQYRSLDSINLYLRNLVQTYPTLCIMDSMGLSYENRQMYGLKISDNPSVSEPSEPGVFVCALHHSREWATPEVVLFFADSILRAYSSNWAMQELINNHEIWIFPAINPDGYVWDYPAQRSWRKNRQPFNLVIGTDINRNYMGSCDGNRFGMWGALTSGAQSSHYPSSETFLGSYGASSPEITNVVNFFKTHNINTCQSFHSYSELVLWPWGYQNNPTPDNSLFVRVGTAMANMITKVSGSGTYTPGQIPSLYPVSSGCDDWVYGWNRWVNGVPCLAFTNEVGTSFYQSVSQLDQICRQNFKSIYYLANFSDSVRILVKPAVPPPQISTPDTSMTGNFTISWQPKNAQFNNPTMWEVQELRDYSVYADSLEGLITNWTVQGFLYSTRRAHSGAHSFYSDSANNISNYIRTAYPYLVNSGDSLSFWCWYNLEKNYDAAVAEVSFDTREWFQLGPRLTDTAMSWRRNAYSLAPYAGKSIFLQIRVMTDDGVLKNGFYVDDIHPVPFFNNTRVISSAITDTFCDISVSQAGEHWYRVKGYNITNGWGQYSMLSKVVALASGIEQNSHHIEITDKVDLNIVPNPFVNTAAISYNVPFESQVNLRVFDVQGRLLANLLNQWQTPGKYSLVWNGKSGSKTLSNGVYFIELNVNQIKLTRRIIII